MRNSQCLQIAPHVTGTVASTRGIKITNRKFEMEERNKQKVKINFEMYYMLACTWTFSDPEKENLIQV